MCLGAFLLLMWIASSAEADSGLVLDSAGIAPQSAWMSDRVIVVRCNVKNTGNTTASGFVVGRATGVMTSEDRYRIELQPLSTRTLELAVRIPPSPPESFVNIDVSLIELQGDREVILMQGEQPASKRVSFRKPPKRTLVTAMSVGTDPIPPPDWRWEKGKLFSTYELAMASRVDAEQSNDCIAFESSPVPLNPADWKGIDTFILAEPRTLRDQSTVSTLRNYLASGGRIWVMMDNIDAKEVAPLLGAHQSLEVIDTIELERFTVDVARQSLSAKDRENVVDPPIHWKRALTQGGTITHSIDGWPAAVVFPIGRGELVCTLLDASGWIRRRGAQWSDDPMYQSDYELRPWAKNLVDIVTVQRAAPLIKLTELSYPLDRIGNPVVPRAFVGSILLGFCLALGGFALWRYWIGEFRGVGIAAPIIALLATLPMTAASWVQKRDIPAMVSIFQWIQWDDPSGGSIREAAAVYSSDSQAMQLSGKTEGYAQPDRPIDSGITKVTTEDWSRWHMDNEAWPAGTWRYTSESYIPGRAMVAYGAFDSQGLNFRIPDGLPSRIEDPVLSFVPGAPSLGISVDQGTIRVDGRAPAGGDRWTLESFVDDERSRRSQIYRKLFEGVDRLQIQTRTLLGWTSLFSDGPNWDAPLDRRGAALISMPVQLEVPAVGTEVYVPSAVMEIRNSTAENSTPIFMEAVGRWIRESSNSSESYLEILLPNEVTPLEISALDIVWDIEAPRRSVRLSCVVPEESEPIPLCKLDEPSVPWEATIQDPKVLQSFRSGTLRLKVFISDDRQPGGSLPWRIKHLLISARGKTLPKHDLVPQPPQ